MMQLLEVVAKAIYLLNFYSGLSMCPAQDGLLQGCEAVVKMIQFRLRSSCFHKRGSRCGALGFHECGSGSGALFLHGSGFCSFSHIKYFNCLGVAQVEWKMH